MDISFNPHDENVFAFLNNSVYFYQVDDNEDLKKNKDFHPKIVSSEDLDVKCFAWNPSTDYKNLIALGQLNGKAALKYLGSNDKSTVFCPKHSRSCNVLAWSRVNPTRLAMGLDKHRNASSLLIWDLNIKNTEHQSTKTTPNIESRSTHALKPFLEIAQSDAVNSLVWINKVSANSLIAGHGMKYLKVYDIRTQPNQPASSPVNHKATMGLCVNPLQEIRVASFNENTVALWDLRSFSKPISTFNVEHNISKIEWSPTRNGFLAVLQNGINETRNELVNIYDINLSLPEQERSPPFVCARSKLQLGDFVSGFTWSPQDKHLLTVSNSLTFTYPEVHEKISLSWRTRHDMNVASGNTVNSFSLIPEENNNEFVDVTSLIEKRAKNRYGLNTENPSKNFDLSFEPENMNLRSLWNWIGLVKQMATTPVHNVTTPTSPVSWESKQKPRQLRISSSKTVPAVCFAGVYSLLKGETHNSNTETVTWVGLPTSKTTVYTSTHRNRILAMCDWDVFSSASPSDETRFTKTSFLEKLVRRVSKTTCVERACTIALWHGNMKLAVEVLNKASKTQGENSNQLSMVSMALSGYTGVNSPSLWLDTCQNLMESLESPYLQAMFSFLFANAQEANHSVGQAGKYEQILNNKELLLQDLVAFACIYLPDNLLSIYIKELVASCVENGALDGVLVTGLSTAAGVNLLAKYYEMTSDIQTILTAVIHTGDKAFLLQPRILHWKESYTDLLNKWELYFERIDFDKMWNKSTEATTDAQTYVVCNYCGKNISNSKLIAARGTRYLGGGMAMQCSTTSCPSCRKPLPRCSVCSTHLGARPEETEFVNWLSWCMSCNHGGHAGHLMDWFRNHKLCPVSDCSCVCYETPGIKVK
uniref:GATOR complex protein MIOS isoform X1 n=1 Tax=Ciona intestinalis TaxID=7719 RepID=UPI000521C156|nr:GATOR complex protein MIOS isoform X1 [Ciona intestinalis]XP_026694876.1 GATOR complex protein MIOS isoform X1 [Ciona intestinalis]|eukprot:XP_009861787.1 GATOR complex protein MIOS isoform X1 [Ciona intestinalis]